MLDKKKIQFIRRNILGKRVILDAGCGSGRFLTFLNYAVWYLVGIDISLPLLREAKSRCKDVDFIQADIHHIPLRSCVCSSILCLEVIDYSSRPQLALKEFKRVLCDGVLLVSIPNKSSFYMFYYHLLNKIRAYASKMVPSKKHFWTFSSFKTQLDRLGFEITDVMKTDLIPGLFYYLLERIIPKEMIETIRENELSLAEHLPISVVNGWFFSLKCETRELNNLR